MDRKKEVTKEEQATEQPPLMPSASTPKKIKKNNINIPTTTTDDDTSTESFELWTLVNKKEKPKYRNNLLDLCFNHVEIMTNVDNDETTESKECEKNSKQEPQLQASANDVANDDLSDGISIISESESVGRISPNPYLPENSHNLSMKFALSDHMDDTILNKMREEMEKETVPLLVQQPAETTNQQLRQRRGHPASAKTALQKASKTKPSTSFLNTVGYWITIAFIIMSIAVTIFIVWSAATKILPHMLPLYGIKYCPSFKELEFKIDLLALKNSDMRNEIELLNRRVKYLYSLKEPQQQQKSGKEQGPAEEPVMVDEFGQVVKMLKNNNNDLYIFEETGKKFQDFQEYPFEQDIVTEKETPEKLKKYYIRSKPGYSFYYGSTEFDENGDYTDENSESNKENNKDDNLQNREYKKDPDHVNSHDNSKERNEWKTDKFESNSKERKSRKDNSKEHEAKYFDDSKENPYNERNNKQKRKNDKKKGNDYDDSGEWQEKYMKHREEQRKQNEENYQANKNWYMKRAVSRENKRSGEKQYR